MPYTRVYKNERYGYTHILVVLLPNGLLMQRGHMTEGGFIGDETSIRQWDSTVYPWIKSLWNDDGLPDEDAIYHTMLIEHYL